MSVFQASCPKIRPAWCWPLHSPLEEVVVAGGITELELLFPDEFMAGLAVSRIDDDVVKTAAAGASDVERAGRRLLAAADATVGAGSTTAAGRTTVFGPSFLSAKCCFNLVNFCSFCNKRRVSTKKVRIFRSYKSPSKGTMWPKINSDRS